MGTNCGNGRGMVYRAGGELTMMELIRTDHMQGNVMARFWGGRAVNSKGEDFLTETYKRRWSRSYAMHVEEEKGNGPLYWDSKDMDQAGHDQWEAYTSDEKNYPDVTLMETYPRRIRTGARSHMSSRASPSVSLVVLFSTITGQPRYPGYTPRGMRFGWTASLGHTFSPVGRV